MTREEARIVLYQLISAREALKAILSGEGDPKEIATAEGFKTLCISAVEVDEFFATAKGQQIAQQFKV